MESGTYFLFVEHKRMLQSFFPRGNSITAIHPITESTINTVKPMA